MYFLNNVKDTKLVLLLFVILLWIYSILSPNVYYFDDNYRAAGGFYNWGGDFRPFADWLYYFIGLGTNFTDLTPLPQIIAILFTFLIYRLYVIYIFKCKSLYIETCIFLPIVFSPFLLSNLYFRYDSIFMLFSMYLAVYAVILINNNKYLYSLLIIFISCGFYQPSIIAFICTSLFYIYQIESESNRKKRVIIWLTQSTKYFFVFLGGVILYYVIIIKNTKNFNNYASTHTSISVENFFPNILKSIDEFSIIFEGDSGVLFLSIFYTLVFFNLIYHFSQDKIFGILIFIIVNSSFIISSAGVNVFLDIPRFEYRTFIFFGFYISYLLYGAYRLSINKKYKNFFILLNGITIFYFISIALNVSNALKSQSKFEEMIVYDLSKDLYQSNVNLENLYFFIGKSSPQNVKVSINKYPIIDKTILHQVHFSFRIKKYYPELKIISLNNKEKDRYFFKNNLNNMKLILDSYFYNIYEFSDRNITVIYFKNGLK